MPNKKLSKNTLQLAARVSQASHVFLFFLVRSRIPWSRISTRAVLWLGKWTEGKRESKFKRITGTGNRGGRGEWKKRICLPLPLL